MNDDYSDISEIAVADKITYHKKRAEAMFCACVLSNSELVLHDCRWLDPDIFSNNLLKAFWKSVLEGCIRRRPGNTSGD